MPEETDTMTDSPQRPQALPAYLRPVPLAIVLVGGTVGTGVREALAMAFPPIDGVSYAIFGVNIVGAFLLGLLLDALVRQGPDQGGRRVLRLLLGTGFMGGLTTYSTLATDSALLIGSGSAAVGAAYAIATVLVGAAATYAGIVVAAVCHRSLAGREK